MHGGDGVLIGQAAVGLGVVEHAISGPDVLALVAIAAGALADEKIAQFAEIVAPRIGEIFRRRLVEHQRLVVELAMVRRALAPEPPNGSGVVAIAPRHEGLRLDVARRVGDRKPHAGIDMIVGAAGHFFPAGILDQIARAVISEIRFCLRPAEIEFRLRNFCRRAAGGAQQIQKSQRQRIGFPARQMPRRRPHVVALDRQHIRHAEALEHVAHMRFAQDAADAGKLRRQILRRRIFLFDVVGRIEVVDKGRARYLEHDRLFKADFEAVGFVAQREGRVVAGGARQKELGRMKAAEIFFRASLRRACRRPHPCETHRHRTAAAPGRVLLAMPAKRLPVIALRRAKASAGGSLPWSGRLAAAASQSTSLSVTAGLSISPAAAGPATSNARLTRTARFNRLLPFGPGRGAS